MKEQILNFGQQNRLVGIYTSSDGDTSDKPVFIILTSGVMHRVGACRTAVKIARHLAGQGICSLRFDFSGIGDSLPRLEEVDLEARNTIEAREAMDFIEKKFSTNRFVLYGLCSGARDAFKTALEDERVAGIVQVDGYAYRNWRHYFKHYAPRLVQLSHWSNFLFKRVPAKIRKAFAAHEKNSDENMFIKVWPDYPPRKQIENGYQKLVNRGVRFYIIFTGSWIEQYNYKEQFYHMYSRVSFGDLVTLEYMPNAVHILTNESDQNAVTDGVAKWLVTLFPECSPIN